MEERIRGNACPYVVVLLFPEAICATTWITGADALRLVFQAIITDRLSHASPAWLGFGFASADDRHRLESLLVDRQNWIIEPTVR